MTPFPIQRAARGSPRAARAIPKIAPTARSPAAIHQASPGAIGNGRGPASSGRSSSPAARVAAAVALAKFARMSGVRGSRRAAARKKVIEGPNAPRSRATVPAL